MTRNILSIALAVTSLSAGALAQTTTLIGPSIRNGSFESPTTGKTKLGFEDPELDIPGWGNTGSVYDDTGAENDGRATEGARVAFFEGDDDGAFNLTSYVIKAGDQFTLTFDSFDTYNYFQDNFDATLFSSTDGTYQTAFTLAISSAPVGLQRSLTYTATLADAGKTIGVAFDTPANRDVSYAGLDNVVLTVTAVPEPSTLGFGALATAGLAAFRRRRA
jgi:hypothetical protein